jgi:hypothetical protein
MNDKSAEIPEFYINGMKVAVSPFDITLEMGVQEVAQVPPDTIGSVEVQSVVRPTVRIRISPLYAILLSRVLDKAMADYQQKNGYLNLPHELLTKLGLI